jgi:hypothetical protein
MSLENADFAIVTPHDFVLARYYLVFLSSPELGVSPNGEAEKMQFPKIDWDLITLSRAEAIRDDDDEKNFDALRRFFGEDTSAVPLPIYCRLLNNAEWTCRWIAWFVQSLEQVKSAQGYDDLCAQLRNHEKCASALTVLQVAERASAIGLEIAFEMPVRVGLRRKVADLLLRDRESGASIYTEVSIQFTAQSHVSASNVFHRIVNLFTEFRDDPLAYNGFVLRPVPDEEAEGIVGRVRLEILEVRRDRDFRLVHLPGVLVLALAPQDREEEVEAWARASGLEPKAFGAAMPQVDHLVRLDDKIAYEAEQLPDGFPNLMVLWAQSLFVALPDPLSLVPLIEGVVSRHHKVAVLVIVFEGYGSAPIAHAVVKRSLVAASRRDGDHHQFVVVPNPAASVPMPEVLLDRLKQAFSF